MEEEIRAIARLMQLQVETVKALERFCELSLRNVVLK